MVFQNSFVSGLQPSLGRARQGTNERAHVAYGGTFIRAGRFGQRFCGCADYARMHCGRTDAV